jgi:serine/threonine-protein kinase
MSGLDDGAARRLLAFAALDEEQGAGDVVGDRFEVDAQLGEGGMGVVHRALDRTTGDLVALKRVRVTSDAEKERFLREVAAVATLNHPNVVRYVAHGACDDGRLFLAMELCDGETLAARLRRGALAPKEAARHIASAASGLGAAHARGLVHRDVKPSNLLLTRDGPVKVIDWGLARGAEHHVVTASGSVVGTPSYMAPEQVRSGTIDARTDVFALGAVLFECLTGRAAFIADSTEGALAKALLEVAPRVRSIAPDTPVALDTLVARMLSADPEARPANGDEVARALASIDGSPAEAPTEPASEGHAHHPKGTLLAGRYRVERTLGEGGMGVVLEATHVALGRRVAIKLLRGGRGAGDDRRLFREARAASGMSSEHIAKVLDFGALEDGAPFLVMELVEGADLARVLSDRGRLPAREAVAIIIQATRALAEAHEQGVIHRDLKPSNLMLSQRADGSPLVKVLDFGISKIEGASAGEDLTVTSMALGSPRYMSPEQLKSARDVGPRADVWGLGVVLYELLAGKPAFDAGTAMGVAAKIASEPPAPLENTPEGLEAIVLRCLEKDASKRFATVNELAEALSPFERESTVSLARSVPPPVKTGATKRASRVAYVLAATAVCGAAAIGLLSSGKPSTPGKPIATATTATTNTSAAPTSAASQVIQLAASASASNSTPPSPPAASAKVAVLPKRPPTTTTAAPSVKPSAAPQPTPTHKPAATVDPRDPALDGR